MSTPAGGGGDERSFANVLNNLSSGPWRSGLRRTRSTESSTTPEPGSWSRPVGRPAGVEEWGESDVPVSAARPYTWTGGRTSSVVHLAIETLVSTSTHGRDVAALTSVEHRAVAELCRDPRSVAEVAALLSLPLGVARVLLGDMAGIGLIVVHRTANASGDAPEVALMERVLSGLRRL
ncbi:MAG TPA: DUF742 domain-containing protein [Pseudonocardiaceae bacterium]|nr:DUF742 domain-containing protein [Pseudonocardiaceae bacterium]